MSHRFRPIILSCIQVLLCCVLLTVSAPLLAKPLPHASAFPACWQQISDHTGKTESVVKIWENHHILYGKIIRTFKIPGVPYYTYCHNCSGKFAHRPILNLTFIWGGVETAPNYWTHLKVLDPKSGKIYKGHLTLIDQGSKLKLRGYIGIPLLGRTQTWFRTICPNQPRTAYHQTSKSNRHV